jgi:hypothetical protein
VGEKGGKGFGRSVPLVVLDGEAGLARQQFEFSRISVFSPTFGIGVWVSLLANRNQRPDSRRRAGPKKRKTGGTTQAKYLPGSNIAS